MSRPENIHLNPDPVNNLAFNTKSQQTFFFDALPSVRATLVSGVGWRPKKMKLFRDTYD